MSRPRKQGFMICEVKPNAQALRHFKVKKFDNSGLYKSQWA